MRTLDLQPIEDTLREELAEIRGAFQEDALDDIAAAYAEVVGFLAELDPQAALAELEAEPMQALRDALDAVDPEAILAPVSEALDEFRSVLAGFDLSEQVLAPLEGVFEPLVGALAGLDPRGLLAPITAEIDRVRELVAGVLQLDTISAGLASFRERAVEVLGRIDQATLAGTLGNSVTAELAKLPAGPPGGPFGSLLVTLGQAAGLDATEPAVADTIAWVGGRTTAAPRPAPGCSSSPPTSGRRGTQCGSSIQGPCQPPPRLSTAPSSPPSPGTESKRACAGRSTRCSNASARRPCSAPSSRTAGATSASSTCRSRPRRRWRRRGAARCRRPRPSSAPRSSRSTPSTKVL